MTANFYNDLILNINDLIILAYLNLMINIAFLDLIFHFQYEQ